MRAALQAALNVCVAWAARTSPACFRRLGWRGRFDPEVLLTISVVIQYLSTAVHYSCLQFLSQRWLGLFQFVH